MDEHRRFNDDSRLLFDFSDFFRLAIMTTIIAFIVVDILSPLIPSPASASASGGCSRRSE
jgi:hypothetical protein